MASSIEAIQKILQETVAPGISDIKIELAGMKADIKSLQSEIKRLDDKIDFLRNGMNTGFARLDDKIDNGLARQDERMDHLEDKLTTALEIRERLAALEARVSAHR